MAGHLTTLEITVITESYCDCLLGNQAALKTDLVATETWPILVNVSITDSGQWRSINSALTHGRRTYLLLALWSRVTRHFHCNLLCSHCGASMPTRYVFHAIFRPAMQSVILIYTGGCELCNWSNTPHYPHNACNMALSPPFYTEK